MLWRDPIDPGFYTDPTEVAASARGTSCHRRSRLRAPRHRPLPRRGRAERLFAQPATPY